MIIGRICFPVTTLGPGARAVVWTSGCKRNCTGCMSPELRSFDTGKKVDAAELAETIMSKCVHLDGITISGGEPFEQVFELRRFVERVKEHGVNDIIIFTGYTLSDLRERQDADIDVILSEISVLIDGEYIDELNDGKGLRGSSNQQIHIFSNHEKYEGIAEWKREIQLYSYQNRILYIGIL